MSDRASYDPFAPRPLPFPAERLERAGLDEAARDNLAERYEEMSGDRKRAYVESVSAATDGDLAARYTVPEDAKLDDLTVPALSDLLTALGQPVSGKKDELLARVREHRPAPVQAPQETPEGGDGDSETPETPTGAPGADDGDDDPEETPVTQTAGETPTPVVTDSTVLGEQPATAPEGETQTEPAGETPEPQA